ncbi:TetR/AcrR family transcriptional regulator [Nonomuraea sp. NPDC050404]|uniref:TetR/AcrR family transcriptional regulator n=1 Tax=Nonomuraea sp. NPDC050404 TaxID=3155783 RepID=UPI0033FC1ABC
MDDKRHTGLPPGIALAWGVMPSAGRRGPKPAFSVERIVEAAVEVADAEGFAGLSMPKIAERLGVTGNALYRYIRSKEELVVLLADAGWGPPPESVRQAGNWRDAATEWTRAMIARALAHPWVLDVPVHTAPVTPHLVGWLECFLEGMADAGLGEQDTLGCALLLDGYARSVANLAHSLNQSGRAKATSAALEFLLPLLGDRGYPRTAALMTNMAYIEDDLPQGDVEFGLNRILDGIETLIGERGTEH